VKRTEKTKQNAREGNAKYAEKNNGKCAEKTTAAKAPDPE